MIICPNCREEIDDDSRFCDQCGQALLFCNRCGRVGIGRRCTHCGGLMVSYEEYQKQKHAEGSQTQFSLSMTRSSATQTGNIHTTSARRIEPMMGVPQGIPALMLYNMSLNIRIQGINGAVIGRRQGPYASFFENNMYISGVHAQLKYNATTGWCIVDKHSSNGTKLNQHPMQPDVEMSLKDGDIVGLANINLQVSIN